MDEFVVYKIFSDATSSVYYGYVQQPTVVLLSFLAGAKRDSGPNATRGASIWLDQHGDDYDSIQVEIVDVCIDELEAWCVRNDLRSSDLFSITGPSNWPDVFSRQIKTADPDRLQRWKHNMSIRNCKTARQAMQLGALTFQQVKVLQTDYDKQQIVSDLDTLSPVSFCNKYQLTLKLDCGQ